jgi:chemotaxis protein MotB
MSKDSAKPTVIIKKIKKGGHAGHHGGAWKVAYADFITCMFALFLVLWLLTQADLKLRQEIARYFRNSGVQSGGSMLGDRTAPAMSNESRPLEAVITIVQTTGTELEALRGQAKAIQETLEHDPTFDAIKDHVSVKITGEGLEIQVVDSGDSRKKDLLFDLSSAQLKPALVTLLKTIGGNLAKLPNEIDIGGHTDARPYPAASGLSNWQLSFERANNARKVLESSGIRDGQVTRVTAFADTRLLNAENPLADENRRLTILARREGTVVDAPSQDRIRNLGGEAIPPPLLAPDAVPPA